MTGTGDLLGRRPEPRLLWRRRRRTWAFFRDVNNRMIELGLPSEDETEPLWLVCECPELDCVKTMIMTHAEFFALRAEDGLYAVLPGHEDRRSEEIVGRADGYVLVRPALHVLAESEAAVA